MSATPSRPSTRRHGRADPIHPPDGEFVTPPELASEPDTYRGHAGVRRYFDSFYEVMDEIRIEPVAVEEAGDGAVLLEFDLHATGGSTGIPAKQRGFGRIGVADGKITGMTVHATREEALAPPEA